MPTDEKERPVEVLSKRPLPLLQVFGLLLVAPASAALGFFAVVYSEDPSLLTVGERRDAAASARDAIDGGTALGDAGQRPEASATGIDELALRTAPSVTIGEPYYWRCWDAGKQTPLPETACDRMRPFERVVASRLGIVIKCFERLDRPDSKGLLSLAIDVDFGEESGEGGDDQENGESGKGGKGGKSGESGSIGFWSGRSTTLDGADTIISCLRNKIASLPLAGIRHKRQRYTIFFPIEFRGEENPEKGTSVELIMDRVRLREEPVKGKILARLKRGEPILVFEIHDGWAKVKTADGREGWIFVDAITSQEL